MSDNSTEKANELTDDQINTIEKTISDNTGNESKILNDVKDGKIKSTDSGLKEATTNTTNTATDDVNKSLDNMLEDLGSRDIEKENDDFEFTADAIKNNTANSAIIGNQNVTISDDSVLKLIDIMNKVKNKEDINIYSEFPDEIKGMINNYLAKAGYTGYNAQVNTFRNSISRTLIEEFIDNVTLDHYQESFNNEMEHINEMMDNGLSEIFKEYDDNRSSYLESLLAKVPEEDTEKREKLTKTLDAIHDSYALDRIKERYKDHPLKLKRITVEKYKREFTIITNKYKNSKYHIYDLNLALDMLNKYNIRENPYDNICFLILFTDFCRNYHESNVEEHAFMYYTIYNIMLLDVYKGDDYTNFATDFLANINEIISYIKMPNMENLYTKKNK